MVFFGWADGETIDGSGFGGGIFVADFLDRSLKRFSEGGFLFFLFLFPSMPICSFSFLVIGFRRGLKARIEWKVCVVELWCILF